MAPEADRGWRGPPPQERPGRESARRSGGGLFGGSRWRTLALLGLIVLVVGVALRRHPSTCSTHPPSGPNADNARLWVASAVADVPCPSTGRAIYGLTDSAGQPMAGLDPIADPRGGYLGVYSTAPAGNTQSPAPGSQLVLARSSNLTSWRRIRVLTGGGAQGAGGAGYPTLQATPGGGYLLAFQSAQRIRLAFYRSLSALLAARQAASSELPLRLSRRQNGAPWFESLVWNGNLRRSQLTLGFDYRSSGSGGLEREGIGVVRGLRSWSARPDSETDGLLDQGGLTGDHGQQRQFTVAGRSWRILDAQELASSRAGTQAGWHVALYDLAGPHIFLLKLGTPNGTIATSFGSPVARVLPAPAGGGQALVVSLYLFGSEAGRGHAGELLYWNPIG
jgi:hypothetical protein